jgi:molybdopterin-containing oxidoreductase family membrane subunit
MTTSTVSVKKVNPVLIVAILLAMAGIGVWVYQLIVGMQATGLSQQIVWGLYISAFFTAVGAGAALLALTGVSEFVPLFQVTNGARNLCLALSSFIIGALLIALDVGNPLNIWRVMTAFQLSSWMTWDFWLLVIAGVVALVYLLAAQNNRAQKVLGILGILAGIAVVVVEGWMLSSQAARPMWGSGMTVASFLLGAAIAGLSIALIAGLGGESVPFWLKVALGLSLVLVLVEVLSSLVGSGEEAGLILTGFISPAFWLQVIVGLLAPIVLLVLKKFGWLAGILALFGVLTEKVWVLAAGTSIPWMPGPQGIYSPSLVEIVAVIGMIAIGVLIYRLLILIFKA